MTKFFEGIYAEILNNIMVKISVIAFYGAYVFAAIYGIMQVS